MQNPENNLIIIQTHKEITRLYKHFLEIIEDIRVEHPECLTKEKYEHIRKRVLDTGNECQRQMLNFLDFFDFTINKDKVEESAKQKKVVKKFITSNPIVLK
jgi:hypothetical protein